MIPIKTKCISILFLFLSFCLFPSENPEILWRYTTGGRIITPPVEGPDGTIYFCSEDRHLYALSNNGNILWRTNLEDRITETLSLGIDGTIYAGTKRGHFLAVNPMGEKLWKINLNGIPLGNPAIGPDGSIFIATTAGWLYSVSHTGFIRWEVRLPAPPVLGPVLGNDIYIALNNERIYSYSINGVRLWTFLLSGNAESLVLSMDSIYAGTDNSTLVSIDFTGTRVWNIALYGPVSSIIVLTNNRVVCTSGNNILMVDSFGKTIWNKTELKPQWDLAAYSNKIVTLDSEGGLFWRNTDGVVVNQLRGGIPVRRILGASDGNIYLGSKDWLFYKYGFKNLVNDNYVEYIWPNFSAGIGNRGYLLTKKIDFSEKNISGSSDYVYLMAISKNLDERKLNGLLDEIEFRLFKRDVDAGKIYLITILKLLASDCIKRPLYEDGRLINDFPLIRSRAVEILGITGSLQTIEFLVDMLTYEWDDYVVNLIILSLGNLRSDKDRFISNGISNYYNDVKNTGNERFFNQILLTVQKLNSYNGTTSIGLLELITEIFLNSSFKSTKELALDTINSLKK